MKNANDRESVAIIGAGPGGLAAAILLASVGLKVRIFERLGFVGGRTSTIEAAGFRFDLGPTFFLYPRVLDEIMRAAGTTLRSELDMVRLDPQYRIQFAAGGQLDATPDLARMEEEIAKLCPGDVPGFRRFIAENRRKLALSQPCLETPFRSWRDLLRPNLLRMLSLLHPLESLDTYLRRFFTDQRVRLAFSFQSKYLGMSPFRCPSLFSILSFLEYEHGVWHPRGGCGEVSRAMARVAERLGVEISLEEPVEEVLFEGRRACGVRTRSGEHRAGAVVLNGDFAHAIQRLVPNRLRRRWSDARIARKKFSCSTFMLYLGVEGTFRDLPHHVIHISADYERNLDEIERLRRVPTEPSFYVQNACTTEPELAPRGHSALYLLAPVPHQSEGVDWRAERERFRRLLLRRAALAGFTDLERRIRFERVITPAEWEQNYALHRGATFNLAHSLGQMLHLRPRNRFDDVDGLYLVGGGTHPGSGLPVIYEGARITARLLCEDLGVPFPALPNAAAAVPSFDAAAACGPLPVES
jgi:phytoene desaturase